ncbi:MAG: CHAT domain-containing protein [Gomphosphaeria aponina SAG 52.96 = DSM 107014]|uniref:CHAT domain-containing protein n=1 Tax=Gomphosphaeria aponina SAG 52.96 = DSM 107014 TaxID=1521640 RepID=A0A941GWZ2_9CHRO|nr:CHAT domain-containing protein [Gomphosphaeria aponina SAG 52.96 = DSM 107014]
MSFDEVLKQIGVLNQEAKKLYEQTNYKQAIIVCEQACNVGRENLLTDHPYYASSLHNLAVLYQSTGRYAEAEPLLLETKEIRKKALGDNHPDYATTLNNLASLYYTTGRFSEAEPLLIEAKEIRKKALGDRHPDYATSLNNLASLYYLMKRYEEAEKLYEQGKEIIKNTVGTGHTAYATSLNNLAYLYQSMGRYPEAEVLYLEGIEINKKTLGTNHPHYGIALNNLAYLYQSMGWYKDAEKLYQQGIEISKKTLGAAHPHYATALKNLADLYQSMGQYAAAEKLYLESQEINKNNLGKDDPHYATTLNNLASVYQSMGRYAEAEKLYREGKEIIKKVLGNDNIDYGICLNNLADLYQSMGRYAEAEPLYLESKEIRKKTLGDDHPDYAASLNDLASVYQSMGRYAEAETLLLEAKVIRQKVLGNDHPDYGTCLYNLAFVKAATNHPEAALTLMEEAAEIDSKFLEQIFTISSDTQRQEYLQKNYQKLEKFLSLVVEYLPNNEQAIKAAFNLVLRRKALTTEAAIMQRIALLSRRYVHLTPQLEKRRQLGEKFVKLIFDIPPDEKLLSYQENLADLKRQKAEVEEEIREQMPELKLQEQLLNVDCGEVALALPEDGVLLEFVRFHGYDFKAVTGDLTLLPERYLVFTLTAREPEKVKMIDLGEAETIEQLLKGFRKNVAREELFLDDIFEDNSQKVELYNRVFLPLKPYLRGQLFIAPDGELNTLSFELLPTETGNYLMEEYQISYLSVGRDLLRLQLEITAEVTEPLIIANPDYNLGMETSQTPCASGESEEGFYAAIARYYGVFSPLVGTEIEGEEVAAFLGVKPSIEQEALKSQLSNCSSSPRILHLATHSYFLPDIEEKFPPLLRSGLAFAGVNTLLQNGQLPPEAEDGFLTGKDLVNLNLVGTELVVASACETTLPEVNIGAGVMSLRRGFIQAGAKTLIMSLWRVPDIAKAIFMERFYHYLLYENQGRRDALQQAKDYVRHLTVGQMRQQWLTEEAIFLRRCFDNMTEEKDKQKAAEELRNLSQKSDNHRPYEHPKYWGAFVCIGNPDKIIL